eukprot:COSAG03_NODE_2296_length_2907_cov_2.655271_1_plen_72_part_00
MNAGSFPYQLVVLSLTDPPERELQLGIEAFVRSGGVVVLSVEHLTQARAQSSLCLTFSDTHTRAHARTHTL